MGTRNTIYYLFKPFLPWSVRYFARRLAARRIRRHVDNIWPIDEQAAEKPRLWPGWPEQRQLAFVITHDVEGPEGLENCRRIAELEMSFGVRSSFNFIPEGSYVVPPDLREWLERRGFEVGIHDLHHDGKLFDSADGFSAKARRINYYLREWRAVGFRAGFMLRNLNWYHHLDLLYDCSTFDTDPFEPQPDGTRTIFPFWIPSPAAARSPVHEARPVGSDVNPAVTGARVSTRGGYVELPYTLPQDSTLFLLLNESSPEIWLRKLDWIAAQGGMALINVHPDYVRFEGDRAKQSNYPVEHYRKFLQYATSRYAATYWQPLPKQLAAWYRSVLAPAQAPAADRPDGTGAGPGSPTAALTGRRAAVLLYSNYPDDPRPRRAAEAMIEAGMAVDLFCLSKTDGDKAVESIKGVQVFRHPMQRQRGGVWTYLSQYSRFGFSAFWFLSSRGLRRKYDVVHVHNMPDFLVLAAVLPRLRGSRVILDLHDPSPELMTTIFGLSGGHWFVGVLRFVERVSIGLANVVLTPNIAFKNLFASRSCRAEKVSIVMNSPEPTIFDPDRFSADRAVSDASSEFRVMHHGLIAHRHGVDLLVEAIALLRPRIPQIRLDIYGGKTDFLEVVLRRASELGASDIVRYHGSKSQAEIALAIRECHVGVVPNRRSVFTEINFPTRLFEYLAMQRPVVAPDTQGIRDYFGPEEMLYFEPGNVADLAEQIAKAFFDARRTQEVVERGVAVYRRNLWREQKKLFLGVVAAALPPPVSPI